MTPPVRRLPKYLLDQHGNYAPTEGNRTSSRFYIAQSTQSYGAAAPLLAGTPRHEAHIVARMEIDHRADGAMVQALEAEWIDNHLCPGLVSVNKGITAAMDRRTRRDAAQLLELFNCSKADIYLHTSFLRALPLSLDRHGTAYSLHAMVRPILDDDRWPAYTDLLLGCCQEQERDRQAKWLAHPLRQKVLHLTPSLPELPQPSQLLRAAASVLPAADISGSKKRTSEDAYPVAGSEHSLRDVRPRPNAMASGTAPDQHAAVRHSSQLAPAAPTVPSPTLAPSHVDGTCTPHPDARSSSSSSSRSSKQQATAATSRAAGSCPSCTNAGSYAHACGAIAFSSGASRCGS